MEKTIQETLSRIEQENNIKILYAVESGSRAWGFASADSDYDVRYIYMHPMEEYLRIDSLPDTLEGPLDAVMDFSGWDLRKTLELLRRSNPSLLEWIHSPVCYRTSPEWESAARIFRHYYDPVTLMHHYLSMAQQHLIKVRAGEDVKLKHYLYALRPILCCRWLETRGTMPPVPFARLQQETLPAELAETVEEILKIKTSSDEILRIPRNPRLDAFLESELVRLREAARKLPKAPTPGCGNLNAMFRCMLRMGSNR